VRLAICSSVFFPFIGFPPSILHSPPPSLHPLRALSSPPTSLVACRSHPPFEPRRFLPYGLGFVPALILPPEHCRLPRLRAWAAQLPLHSSSFVTYPAYELGSRCSDPPPPPSSHGLINPLPHTYHYSLIFLCLFPFSFPTLTTHTLHLIHIPYTSPHLHHIRIPTFVPSSCISNFGSYHSRTHSPFPNILWIHICTNTNHRLGLILVILITSL
jgi:hypothetical protein